MEGQEVKEPLPPIVSANYKSDIFIASICAAIFMVVNVIWFHFDYRILTQDEAIHIINTMNISELLTHARPWHLGWWHNCLTVSAFYPPFVYLVDSIFVIMAGQSRTVEQVYVSFLVGVMVAAVYAIVRLLRYGKLAACSAALFLCAYPLIGWLCHTFFLDMPAIAMTAVALAVFLWWRSSSPALWRTIAAALCIACACLTKQLVAAYILPVGIFYLLQDVTGIVKGRRENSANSAKERYMHTILLGLFTAIIGLPYVIANYALNHNWFVANVASFAAKGATRSFLDKIGIYFSYLPPAMSPVLLTIFVLSLFALRRREYRNLLPIIISAIGGVYLTCICAGTDTEDRYMGPFFIATAIFSGLVVEKLYFPAVIWKRLAAISILLIAIYSYVGYSFSPYPLTMPRFAWWTEEHNGNPTKYSDWGQQLVIDTIMKTDGGLPVFLNILPNTDELHVNVFQLLLKERKNISIFPTSSRVWRIVGDQVDFSQTTALYPQWYLWKGGSVGFCFFDKQSENNFSRLVDFVRHSGNYRAILQKSLPDGNELVLYRRKY